jgi:hypothetical protein
MSDCRLHLVFTIGNNLVNVVSAAIATGTGSVTSNAIAPNQYPVNLTGVSDQQYVSVALINAKNSTGPIGNIISPDERADWRYQRQRYG